MMKPMLQQATTIAPSPRQLAWQRMEFYAFIHFTVNTFTGREWGDGTEDPILFSPTAFDAGQWVQAIKDAGMTGLILTAKHHDGFCLWPSRFTDHTVAASPWRNGRGDVVREVANACNAGGIKLGIYLSPWDRHEQSYGDSPRYNAYFKNQLGELLTDYGDIFCVWFDGACGEGPNGKRQVYDWDGYYAVIRELQPDATIHVCGPDVRWCGNEAGHCRPSEWSVVPAELLDREKIAEKSQQEAGSEFAMRVDTRDDDLGSRKKIASTAELVWYPAEVNTSIRPGWFYHAKEDDRVKSLEELLDVYFNSVGGNASFLLNVPPDRRGLIHEHDAARLRELGDLLRHTFAVNLAADAEVVGDGQRSPQAVLDGDPDSYWMADENARAATIELTLPEPRRFTVAMLQEQIAVGQRIESFRLSALVDGEWNNIAESTVVGHKRLLRFDAVTTAHVRIEILESRLEPTIANIGLYVM